MPFKKEDKGAACTEAEEGYADDEISKMVPVLYGEHLHQDKLIGDQGRRYEEDGSLNASY